MGCRDKKVFKTAIKLTARQIEEYIVAVVGLGNSKWSYDYVI